MCLLVKKFYGVIVCPLPKYEGAPYLLRHFISAPFDR